MPVEKAPAECHTVETVSVTADETETEILTLKMSERKELFTENARECMFHSNGSSPFIIMK